MLDFALPWAMVAGGALVSAPIIIHLINRMRFKRIRWAAMEFLLKAQKRNRRKLIIEQLILLLLRCGMVLLGALIVARFLGFNLTAATPQTRHHVIILDDTVSMTDQWKEEREGVKTSFKEAKRVITDEIAKNASEAANVQKVKVIRMTNPNEIVYRTDRLNPETTKELGNKLNGIECTALHADLMDSLRKARELLKETPQDETILYIVSDFRQHDWGGPGKDELQKELKLLADANVHLKFVDVAHPARKEAEAGQHANLAIVKLQPRAAVVGQGMPPTSFSVAVANFGPTVREGVQVKIKLDGVPQLQADVPLPPIPAGGVETGEFEIYLDKIGINQVSANIATEEEGLNLDNTRYAVVEVKERVPILAVDGDLANAKRDDSDLAPLRRLFQPSSGYDISPGFKLDMAHPQDLEKLDLNQYPNIYLLNVPELNEKAKANLEAYVKQGGTVCFFMGDKVKADFYNAQLYNEGKGLFPVPLADKATPELTEADHKAREERNNGEPQPQFFLQPQRSKSHKIFSDITRLFGEKEFFKFMFVDRHHPVPREKWSPTPGVSEELMTLPNEKSIDDYKKRVQGLLEKLPLSGDKNKKYQARLALHRDNIRDRLGATSLTQLADAIFFMLNDTGDPNNLKEFPNLKEFWEQDDYKKLASDLERLTDSLRYGDPLCVEGKFGKGRCVVFLTSLGSKWNKWSEGDDKPLFAPMVHELQQYLMSVPADAGQTVGSPIDLDLDAARYDTKMKVFFKPEKAEGGAAPKEGEKASDLEEISKEELALQGGRPGRVQFRFNQVRKPGVYVLELAARQETGGTHPEPRAYAFNIDTQAESNLSRVPRVDLEEMAPTAKIYALGSEKFVELADRQSDLSQGPWLYLIFLVMLIAEQALAVHLSYHLHAPGSATAPATRPTPAV